MLSSRWEGYPNALLENYYLNTPLVATRCVPVVERLVKEGVNGLAVSPEPGAQDLAEAIFRTANLDRRNVRNEPLEYFDFNEFLIAKC